MNSFYSLIQFKYTMKTLFFLGACAISLTSAANLRQGYMYPQNNFAFQPYLNPFSYFPYNSYFPNYNTGMVNTPMQIPPSTPYQIPNAIYNQPAETKPISTPTVYAPTANSSPILPGTASPLYPANPIPVAPNNDFLSLMGLYGLPQQNNGRMAGDNILSSLLGSLNPILQSLSNNATNGTNGTNSTNATNSTNTPKSNDVLINNVKVGLAPQSNQNNTAFASNSTIPITNRTANPSIANNTSSSSANATEVPLNKVIPIVDSHINGNTTSQDQNKTKIK